MGTYHAIVFNYLAYLTAIEDEKYKYNKLH